jgi:hypothetical protein
MNCISSGQSGSSSENIPGDMPDRDKQRGELARLLGRLLARHWLREQAHSKNQFNEGLKPQQERRK